MKYWMVLFLSVAISACANNSVEERRAVSAKVASDAGWQRLDLDAGQFILAAYAPHTLIRADILTVYIEGDGLAWVDSHTPSLDPTPRNPLALRLAIGDSREHAVYLARPCQYVTGGARRNCTNRYWTGGRFAPEVIEAVNQAIDQLKRRYGAEHLVLVGYSGGGAVAALTAAGRNDVAKLITVAGNLDTVAWASQKRLSPLTGSLNPSDAWQGLVNIPQLHFVGGRDKVMGPEFAEAYSSRFPAGRRPEVRVEPEFDHYCCWVEDWPRLMRNERD